MFYGNSYVLYIQFEIARQLIIRKVAYFTENEQIKKAHIFNSHKCITAMNNLRKISILEKVNVL